MQLDKSTPIWKNLEIASLSGEIWKDICDFEGVYMISNMGRVKAYPKQYNSYEYTIIKIFSYRGKHLRVRLYKNNKVYWRCITILVAKAFCKNPLNKKFVQNNDGDGFNAKSSNLKWATRREYLLYAYKTGKCSKKGEKSVNHKLKEDQVLTIFNSTKKRAELAKEFNVSLSAIDNIQTGYTWGFLTKKKQKKSKPPLTKDQVLEIFASDIKVSELSIKYNISNSSVRRVKSGESWGHLTKTK